MEVLNLVIQIPEASLSEMKQAWSTRLCVVWPCVVPVSASFKRRCTGLHARRGVNEAGRGRHSAIMIAELEQLTNQPAHCRPAGPLARKAWDKTAHQCCTQIHTCRRLETARGHHDGGRPVPQPRQSVRALTPCHIPQMIPNNYFTLFSPWNRSITSKSVPTISINTLKRPFHIKPIEAIVSINHILYRFNKCKKVRKVYENNLKL